MSPATPPVDAARHAPARSRSTGRSVLALFCGALGALLELAPWLAAGKPLPLQNLWLAPTLPDDMPWAALPLSQYEAFSLVALLVTGGVLSGLALRWLAGRGAEPRWPVLLPGAVGLAAVHAVAVYQSFDVLRSGLSRGAMAQAYFWGLLAGVVLAALAALAAQLMTAAGPRTPAALALGFAVVPVSSWVLLWAAYLSGPGGTGPWVSPVGRWLPAVLAGVVLAWYGFGGRGSGGRGRASDGRGRAGVGHAVVWVLVLAWLWVLPAAVTAMQTALGSRVLLAQPGELPAVAAEVFLAALGPASSPWWPVLLAAALGTVGALALRGVRPRRQG